MLVVMKRLVFSVIDCSSRLTLVSVLYGLLLKVFCYSRDWHLQSDGSVRLRSRFSRELFYVKVLNFLGILINNAVKYRYYLNCFAS